MDLNHHENLDSSGRAFDASSALALQVTGVSKTFGTTKVLHDVDVSVRQGAVHALLGGNGSGKSTLIKILAGVYQADSGSIEVNGHNVEASKSTAEWAREAGLHFVHQAVGTFASMSVAENFALGASYDTRALAPVGWRRLHRDVAGVLERFELDVPTTARIGDLRPATQTMIAVARALQHEEAAGQGILVLDEPTASLPAEEVELVLEAIRGYRRRGHTVVLVSHRLDEVLNICTDATFLTDGRHMKTQSLAGVTKADLVRGITRSDMAVVGRSQLGLAGPVRLSMDKISSGRLNDISLAVRGGEVLGISGLLGSGRSTLLQTVFGARRPTSGRMEIDGKAFAPRNPAAAMRCAVSYVPEDRSRDAVFADRAVRENVSLPQIGRFWRGGRLRRAAERKSARAASTNCGVRLSSIEAPISTLSGGNQQKVVLARWLGLDPAVLLLDEPTQGVDVGARNAIHGLVRQAASSGCAVVVVSSDATELADLCDRVVGLVDGHTSGELKGDEVTEAGCNALAYQTSGDAEPELQMSSKENS